MPPEVSQVTLSQESEHAMRFRPGAVKRLRALVVFILLASSFYLIALSAAPAPSGSPPATDELKLVVALFRHGVRSPSPDFQQEEADKHSRGKWPALADWKVMPTPSPSPAECDKGNGWGYLTIHGQNLVQGLGVYYGKYYRKAAWPNGFKVYLWADALNQRTRETAEALKVGFKKGGVPEPSVTVASLKPCTTDPLFHPFAAGCGTADGAKLKAFATGINEEWLMWAERTYEPAFRPLYTLLDCSTPDQCTMPLKWVAGCADTCVTFSPECTSPLQWKGRFSYASSAAEAFLLEYANNMDVGWGKTEATSKMQEMLKLHEFYFDKTDRFLGDNKEPDPDLASIGGSNLAREILDQIDRKARSNVRTDGYCPHADAESDFVGLIGHDTNLAGVGALLELGWRFDDPKLPADTRGLPANDALPAGALVFELRQRSDRSYHVRVEYVTQSLEQMRNGPKAEAFRLAVDGPACVQKQPCEMPLKNFQELVGHKIRREFLSRCTTEIPSEQTCGSPR